MSGRARAGGKMPMNVRNLVRAVVLWVLAMGAMAALALPAAAQSSSPRFEFGADYNFVRANGPPGTCACFSMNGGNGWIGYGLTNGFSVVGEFSGQHAGNINGSGEDLTLVSYLFGPKYSLRASERWQPFGQVLLGGAHASGTFEPSVSGGSGSYNSFAMIAGGGLDVAAGEHLALRAFEADYYLTQFPNGVNGRQNNFRISAGVIFRF
jgi:outer membrane immunogenic protein